MPGWLQHKTSSNVMATLSQEKADNCTGKAALYSELETMKDHHELRQTKKEITYLLFLQSLPLTGQTYL